MSQPEEENFENWLLDAISLVNIPEEFVEYIPSLNGYIDSIISTNYLSDPVSQFTEFFIEKISEKKLKNTFIPEEFGDQYSSFFCKIIDFGKYGIENNKKRLVECAYNVIDNCYNLIIRENPNIPQDSFHLYAYESGFYDSAYNLLIKGPESINMLKLIFEIITCLRRYDKNFNTMEFYKFCAEDCLKVDRAQSRIETNVISKIYSYAKIIAQKCEYDDSIYSNFCFPWLNLFAHFIQSNIFAKQLLAFTEIQNMMSTQHFESATMKYFSSPESIKIFDMKTIHPEFYLPLSQIIMKLCKNNCIDTNLLIKLWKLHSFQHSSDLAKFLTIFSSAATTIDEDKLFILIEHFVNPQKNENNSLDSNKSFISDWSEEWVNFLGDLGECIGKRPGSQYIQKSFEIIRDKLFEISMIDEKEYSATTNFDENHFKKLKIHAQNILPNIVFYHLNDDFFENICNLYEINQHSIFFHNLLASAFNVKSFPDKSKAEMILDKSLSFLSQCPKSDIPSVLNFITNLICSNQIMLKDTQFDILFLFRNEEKFSQSFNKLLKGNFIPLDHFDFLVRSLPGAEINRNVLFIVKDFFFYCNKIEKEKPFTKLPFSHEELIWKMGMKISSEQRNFAIILCFFYSHNDGEELTDSEMMSSFINKWYDEYLKLPLSSSNKEKNAALILLKEFVIYIEACLDLSLFNIKRHNINPSNAPIVQVNVKGKCLPSDQKYELPDDTLVISLMHRISSASLIPINRFNLIINGSVADKNKNLRKCFPQNNINKAKNNTLQFFVQVISGESHIQPPRSRECIPSQIIAQNKDILTLLKSLLKENSYEAKMLLDYLPTDLSTVNQIKDITRFKQFDYKSFLPHEYPLVFLYNFETIISILDEQNENSNFSSLRFIEHFSSTGGYKYLIDSIAKDSSHQLTMKVISFLSHMKNQKLIQENIQYIYDTLIPHLASISTLEYISEFDIVSKFLIDISQNNLKSDLTIDDNKLQQQTTDKFEILINDSNVSLINALKSLLLNPNETFREISISIFDNIQIPLNILISFIPFVTDDVFSSFYYTLVPHITKDVDPDCMSQLVAESKKKFSTNENLSPALLTVLNKILDCGLINKEDEAFFTRNLVTKFLNVNSKERGNECFTLAVHCLSKMQNEILLDQLTSLHSQTISYTEWNIDTNLFTVSPTGHCGLENIGANCFLNSILQQFFAIPSLRNKIIEYTNPLNSDNNNDQNHIFMRKLRTLFTRMYLSDGRQQTPKQLIDVWTGWDGKLMDPYKQEDAFEFTQMLIHKLENGLSKEFINELFAGTTIDIFEGISEKYWSEKEFPFISLSLPIKDSNNINESFMKLQEPNFLTGENQYFAESANHKIDAKKIQTLGKLPPYLIIQLSRFEYKYAQGIRMKINSQFTFPTLLDLKSYVSKSYLKDQNNNEIITHYNLRGIIMHQGSADFGHYTSYIKDRLSDKWFLYNDLSVKEVSESEVLKNAYGTSTENSSAYILFYDRMDIDEANKKVLQMKPKISSTLNSKIESENQRKDVYSLFCSGPYFELMKLLAEYGDPRFTLISIYYYFDTLPFTIYTNKANEISLPVCKKLLLKENSELRHNFMDFLTVGPFGYSLMYCPEIEVRKGACQMIQTIDIKMIDVNFLDNIINLLPTIAPYYHVFNQTFYILEYLIANSTALYNHAIERQLNNLLMHLICNEIPNSVQKQVLQSNDQSNNEYDLNADFTAIFSLLKHFNVVPNFITCLLTDSFVQNILKSHTSLLSFADLLNSFYNQYFYEQSPKNYIENTILRIAKHMYTDFTRICTLLFLLFKDKTFELIQEYHFMIYNQNVSNLDISRVLYLLTKYDSGRGESRIMLLNNLDKWLLSLLTDENQNCRFLTENIIRFLITNQPFSYNLEHVPERNDFYEPVDENNQNIPYDINLQIQTGNNILEFMLQQSDHFVSIINNITRTYQNERGLNWLEILAFLQSVTNRDISNQLIQIASLIVPCRIDYDPLLSYIFETVSSNSTAKFDEELLLNFFPVNYNFVVQKCILSALKFITTMEKSVELIQHFPDNFISSFMMAFCFTDKPIFNANYACISAYLKKFASSNPEFTYSQMQNNLEKFASSYLSGILIALEEIELSLEDTNYKSKYKLPILNFLWQSLNTKQFFQMNEMVVKTFKYNNGEISDISHLISLLNSPELLNDGRQCIWSLIYETHPPLSEFLNNYKWKGDWDFLARYVSNQHFDISNNNTREFKIISKLAIEAAQNSCIAFDILFDFLVQYENKSLYSSNFILTIIENSSYSSDIIIRFIIGQEKESGITQNNIVLKELVSNLKSNILKLQNIIDQNGELLQNDFIIIKRGFEILASIQKIAQIDYSEEKAAFKELLNCSYVQEIMSKYSIHIDA